MDNEVGPFREPAFFVSFFKLGFGPGLGLRAANFNEEQG